MHRQILGLKIRDGKFTDHINRNGLDNRRRNLRPCTNAENCRNQKKVKGCSSKFKGVCWTKKAEKWVAYIFYNYKRYYLGYFNNEKDAATAYNKAALRFHGNFARLNII